VKAQQIDHVLISKMWQSNVVDFPLFRGAHCDTDHYLVVERVTEREKESERQYVNEQCKFSYEENHKI
jgi:hypothetical protein